MFLLFALQFVLERSEMVAGIFISFFLLFLLTSKRPWSFRQVFDYDWGLQDDFMGVAQLDLTQLDLGQSQDVMLELKDHNRPKQHLGEIYLTVTLWPRNQQEKEQVDRLIFCSFLDFYLFPDQCLS